MCSTGTPTRTFAFPFVILHSSPGRMLAETVSDCQAAGAHLHLSCCEGPNPVFMDFASRVQPEGSPSQKFSSQNICRHFSKCRKYTAQGSFCNTRNKLLISRQPLNAMSWRIQEERPWRRVRGLWFLQFPKQLHLRKRQFWKFNYLRRVTHQAIVQGLWTQPDSRENTMLIWMANFTRGNSQGLAWGAGW